MPWGLLLLSPRKSKFNIWYDIQ